MPEVNRFISFILLIFLCSLKSYAQEHDTQSIELNVDLQEISSKDITKTTISFINDATMLYDQLYDSLEFVDIKKEKVQLFTVSEDGFELSHNSLPLNGSNWLVPLFIRSKNNGEYLLKISSGSSLDTDYALYVFLPTEKCYLDWEKYNELKFTMTANDGQKASFFIFLANPNDDFHLSHLCE